VHQSQARTRIIGLQSRQHHETLQTARKHQTTEDFKQSYAARAGIEGNTMTGYPPLRIAEMPLYRAPEDTLQHVAQRRRNHCRIGRVVDQHSRAKNAMLPLRGLAEAVYG